MNRISNRQYAISVSIILALYAVALYFSLDKRPLWLDEVIQVTQTYQRTAAQTLDASTTTPGGAPLAFFVQRWIFGMFGYSRLITRLPAATFSLLGGILFAVLVRYAKISYPRLALVIFLALPLQFRYGVEGRGYSQGLFFTVASFLLFLRLMRRPGWGVATVYALSLSLGMYSQPYVVFVSLAQGLAAFFSLDGISGQPAVPLARRFAIGSAVVTLLSFLPWVLRQHVVQAQTGHLAEFAFSVQQVYPLSVLKELTGGGYACSIPMFLLVLVAIRPIAERTRATALWWLAFGVSFTGALLADAIFSYFWAVRQVIFAMPSLTILAIEGAATAVQRWNRWPVILLVSVFLAGAVVRDYRQAVTYTEDWEAAAKMAAHLLDEGGCVTFAPPTHGRYYALYAPSLPERTCRDENRPPKALLILNHYSSPEDRKQALGKLPANCRPQDEHSIGGTTIVRLACP